jgi:hypothetical protein
MEEKDVGRGRYAGHARLSHKHTSIFQVSCIEKEKGISFFHARFHAKDFSSSLTPSDAIWSNGPKEQIVFFCVCVCDVSFKHTLPKAKKKRESGVISY